MRPRTTRPCSDCGRPFTAGPYAQWGRCCRWKHRGRRAVSIWTPERDAIIRERYDSRVRGRAAAIGRSIGVPDWRVKRRAAELGLTHPRGAWRTWTADEVRFLEENLGRRHVHWIQTKLGRSLASVVLKIKHLHLSRRVREGLSLCELEEALGLDHRKIAALVDAGKLRATHRGAERERWMFTDADVREFVRTNPTAFRLDRVDQLWFLDLVFDGRIGSAERPGRAERTAA